MTSTTRAFDRRRSAGPIRLRLIGPLDLVDPGADRRPVIPRGRASLLLALLGVRRNRVVALAEVVDTLWPQDPPPAAEQIVASLISRLRKITGPCLERVGSGYRLDTSAWQVDVDEAARLVSVSERHLGAGQSAVADVAVRRALEMLTAGQPLEEFPAEEWTEELVRAVYQQLRRAREAAWLAAARLGDHRRCAEVACAAIAVDPYDEPAWRALMAAEYGQGSAGAALRTFDRLRRRLRADLGTDPDPRTAALHEAMLRGGETMCLLTRPPVRSLGVTAPRGRLVGRDAELGRLERAWRAALGGRPAALVVRGASGMGKTALMAAVRRHVEDHGAVALTAAHPIAGQASEAPALVRAVRAHCLTAPPEEVRAAAAGLERPLRRFLPELDVLLDGGCHAFASGSQAPSQDEARLEAVASFVLRIATRHPVLLALDDAHHADRESIEAVRRLAGATPVAGVPHRLMVLLTIGAEHRPPGTVPLLGYQAEQLSLEPLLAADVGELACHRGLPSTAAHVHRLTGGHPGLVTEALRAAARGADLTGRGRLPVSLVEAALALVDRAGHATAEFLRFAALVGSRFRLREVLAVNAFDGRDAAAHVDAALRAGLLAVDGDDLVFTAPVVHAALRTTVPAPVRAALDPSRQGRGCARCGAPADLLAG
ncbi:BTAD domain-containing putative transcriptional regulator [Actinacidiphila sp. bgisy160]|uniref:BTAD domain-containing putative transcriptional regulator n=1 Tax=Actinacidiphila sp. bgisy160 TaxID=3413796 RepID=UPI003D7569CA